MSEKSWKKMLQALPMPAVVVSGGKGNWSVGDYNPAAQALVGAEDGAWPGLDKLLSKDDARLLMQRLGESADRISLAVDMVSMDRPCRVKLRMRRLEDAEGAWLCLMEDVTAEQEAMQALRENERSYRRIVEMSPDAIVVLGEGLVVFANQACEQLLGLDSPDEIWGNEFKDIIHSDDQELWEKREALLAESDEPLDPVEMRIKKKDGSDVEVEVTQYRAYGRGRGGMQVILRDIGPRKKMQRELKESEERYKGLADAAFDGVAVHVDGNIREVNRAFEEIFGREPGSMIGEPIEALFQRQHRKYFHRERASGKIVELESSTAKGGAITLEASSRTCRYKGEKAFVTAIRDVTERKKAEAVIRQQAYYDGLTGLPNRILFGDVLDGRLQAAGKNNRGAVLFLDLDRFKQVNDNLGHDAGDRLLQQASQRLSAVVRPGDTVCRLAGDEFTILMDNIDSENDVVLIAQKIVEQLGRPFDLDGQSVQVGSSVGASIFPDHGIEPEELLKRADEAMYAVKASGRNNYKIWKKGLGGGYRERPDMEADLRNAISKREFVLYYQPKIELKTGRVVGAEALVRWRRGSNLLGASEFVPFAEEIGLTLPLGEWALDEACRQARRWKDVGLESLTVSVNLSAWQLRRQALLDVVNSALELHDLPASLLEVEITEDAAMKNPGFTASVLKELTTMGVGVALDDFGTGRSSLEHLKRFPIQTLKIDQSYIHGCNKETKDAAIVRAVIMLAHSLGLQVLAEGVETAEQEAFLRKEGCDIAQGFLYSQAIPAEEIPDLINAFQKNGSPSKA